MEEIVTQPLILNKKSRSSRFFSWSGDANSFRDKFMRSIYIFLLFALDLIMFIYSINGRLWEDGSVNKAVLVILGVVFVFSFVLILLLSFSKDLQNLVCALFTMLVTVMFFYQFGQGNVDSFLEVWFEEHASWLTFLCVVPSPWLIGFFLGILIFIAFRFSDAILFVMLVLLFSGVVGIEKNEILRKTNTEHQEILALPATAGEVSETSVVYLMLPKLPSYQFLNSIRDRNFREFRDLLVGFYAANDFEIYPNAFVKSGDTMSNIIDILNQVDYTSTSSANRGYAELINNWNFIHGGLDKYTLEYDQLYDYMSKQGFGVSMYAMPEFNFCVADSDFASDRCVIKGYKTISLFDKDVPLDKNVFALLGEWVLSLKSRDLKSLAKMLINSSQLKGLKVISENRRVSLEGSPEIFEKLSNDYKRDNGGQFYLAYVDLPSDIYIYDEFCNIKPRDKWVSLKDNTLVAGGIDEKRRAYADQAKCLVGKLQEYMEEISETGKLARTDIFIQGVSPLRELAGVTGDVYSNFVADKLVNLAIRKGKKPRFLINANVCLASDFTKTWLKNQDYCYTIDNMPSYSSEEVLNLKKNLINNSLIRGSRISNIVTTYKDWFEVYKTHSVSYQKRMQRKQDEEMVRQRRDEELERQRKEENRMHKQVNLQKNMSQNNDNIFVPSEDDASMDIGGNVAPQNDGLSALQEQRQQTLKSEEIGKSTDVLEDGLSQQNSENEEPQEVTSEKSIVIPDVLDDVKDLGRIEQDDETLREAVAEETGALEIQASEVKQPKKAGMVEAQTREIELVEEPETLETQDVEVKTIKDTEVIEQPLQVITEDEETEAVVSGIDSPQDALPAGLVKPVGLPGVSNTVLPGDDIGLDLE